MLLSWAAASPPLAALAQRPVLAQPEFSPLKALFKLWVYIGNNSHLNDFMSALIKCASILYNKWRFILPRVAVCIISCWKGVEMSPPVIFLWLEKHSFWLVPLLTQKLLCNSENVVPDELSTTTIRAIRLAAKKRVHFLLLFQG